MMILRLSIFVLYRQCSVTISDLISDENSYFLVLCNIHTTGIKNRNVEAGMIQILWYSMNISVDI